MKLRITVDGQSYEVDVEVLEGAPGAAQGAPAPVSPAPRAAAAPAAARPVAPPPPAAAAPSAAAGEKAVKSPIAGNVTQVKVNVGDAVQLNQVVLVMEAMKMETNIASPVAGTVKAVQCKPGDAVKPGQVLIELS